MLIWQVTPPFKLTHSSQWGHVAYCCSWLCSTLIRLKIVVQQSKESKTKKKAFRRWHDCLPSAWQQLLKAIHCGFTFKEWTRVTFAYQNWSDLPFSSVQVCVYLHIPKSMGLSWDFRKIPTSHKSRLCLAVKCQNALERCVGVLLKMGTAVHQWP